MLARRSATGLCGLSWPPAGDVDDCARGLADTVSAAEGNDDRCKPRDVGEQLLAAAFSQLTDHLMPQREQSGAREDGQLRRNLREPVSAVAERADVACGAQKLDECLRPRVSQPPR